MKHRGHLDLKRSYCVYALLLVISIPGLSLAGTNETTGNDTTASTEVPGNSTEHWNETDEHPKQRGPTKDRLAVQVCENLAKIMRRKKGFQPTQTTNDPTFSQELACKIEPGYPCFPLTPADYQRLKKHYEDGYAIPPENSPGLKENFCLSGKCDPDKEICTECIDKSTKKVIKCRTFKPVRSNGSFNRSPASLVSWLFAILLVSVIRH